MLVSLGLFKLNTPTRGILEAETVLNRSRKEEDHIRSIICTVSENSSLIQMLNGKKTQRLMIY